MTSEELAFVTLDGRRVPYSHAVLIETPSSWYVEIEGLPSDSCPYLRRKCKISFGSWDGERYSGSVMASYERDDTSYLMLTGIGGLEQSVATDASDVRSR